MPFSPKKIVLVVLFSISISFASCGDSHQFSEPLPKTVDFNFHIRPILVQNCFLFHGPDASSRKAEFRLDTYEDATAELKDCGHAIIPRKPSKNQFVYRINHEQLTFRFGGRAMCLTDVHCHIIKDILA